MTVVDYTFMGANTVNFKVDEWDLPIPKEPTDESKITALIERAEITAHYDDGNTRTIKFKKGSVIKMTVHHGGAINSWNPDDELLDTTTR